MKALRLHVERIVRPIRASPRRKDRMREELLAHLMRLYDEQLARTNNPESAVAEAIRRFGDASSLKHELQGTVHWLERWAFLSLGGPIRRRVGESPLRYVLRANGWAFVAGSVGYGFLAFAGTIAGSWRPTRADQPAGWPAQLAVFLIVVAAIQFVTMIAEGLFAERIRQQLERHEAAETADVRRNATWHIVGNAVANSAVLGAAIMGLMLATGIVMPFPLISRAAFWWITLAAAIPGLPLTLLHAWSWKASTRRFENWESLDLEEQCAV